MNVNMASLYKVLKDATRQRIVLKLCESGPLTYVDLMKIVGITSTGKFNYHLKVLGDLVEKGKDGKYRLTETGMLASQLLLKFPAEKPVKKRSISIKDIILIGFVGFGLIMVNPAILEGFLGTTFMGGLGRSVLPSLYGLIVPGALMWLLGVRRMKTHDLHHLVNPALFSLILLVGVTVLIASLHYYIGLKLPLIHYGESGSQVVEQAWDGVWSQVTYQRETYGQLTLLSLPIAGIYSFIGISISEAVYRILNVMR